MKIGIFIYLLLLSNILFAAQIPPGQDVGSTMKEYEEEKQKEDMLKRLKEATPPRLDEKEIKRLPGNRKSIYISKIIVQGNILIDDYIKEDEIDSMIESYENRRLSLLDMKKIANIIKDKIADKRISSYIPRQSFTNGIMYINLVSNRRDNSYD